MKKILLYSHQKNLYEAYYRLLEKNDIILYPISDICLHEKVGNLFSYNQSFLGICEKYQFDYLLFQNISNDELMKILQLFTNASLPFEGIKIAYTETNANWKLIDLFAECEREYFIFTKMSQLRNLLQKCNELDFSQFTIEEKMKFQSDFIQAVQLLEAAEVEQSFLDALIQQLQGWLKKSEK